MRFPGHIVIQKDTQKHGLRNARNALLVYEIQRISFFAKALVLAKFKDIRLAEKQVMGDK